MSHGLDPTLHTAALAALEAGVNRALALSPQSLAQLEALDDCVFALHCTAPELEVFLHPSAHGVRLAGTHDGDVTTSVKGEASDFTELAASADPTATLINGGLELQGDSAPLIELQKVLVAVDIDWEAPLVSTLGDVVGHQLAQVLRHGFSWGQQASKSLTRQLHEFIHEEARLTPPRLELEDFYADVRELEQRVDRLASRAKRISKRITDQES
ncbi:MAG: ubiquinone biosynthesis protein UbiJ [Bacteroidia bacterium]|jgi:ubiquinone biosynthesis protein UbiJ